MDRCPCCRAKPKGDEKREYYKGVIIMNIDTLNYQHKGTVKITSYEKCKNPDGSIDDSASWICFRVLELNDILYKDFIKVLYVWDDESRNMLYEIKKLKDTDTLLTGYLTDKIGDGVYYLYVPELNFHMCNITFFGYESRGKGRKLKLKSPFDKLTISE